MKSGFYKSEAAARRAIRRGVRWLMSPRRREGDTPPTHVAFNAALARHQLELLEDEQKGR